ncbi:phosphate acetyltransferase [Persicobacter psychrovividus]|uniref:Phosphate acetyltransferase n=1 Tax=Persicobacter psychrovividus TaxID=387638 RepID=A0ABM7VDN1_9BACT|nr:phosphate acetyltransferase [Persicobacter psychrovividus]
MSLIEKIKESAKSINKRIVLPEGEELRTLQAADIITEQGLAQLILLGNPETIKSEAARLGLKNIDKVTIVNPLDHPKKQAYADILYDLRKAKGMTPEKALQTVENPLYMATLMLKAGDADGEVAGALNSTGDVLRPAFQVIKTKPGVSVVSGSFVMIVPEYNNGEDGVFVFADCGVTPNPDAKQLAQIAISSAETARTVAQIEPKVALLSFSSKGSAKHEMVDKVIEATEIAKQMAPDLLIDGELQGDAAIVEAVAASKAPNSPLKGQANVLVFPDLNTGNIAYKLVQRLAKARAFGPLLQGVAAPINDLSRGCSIDDIVNTVAITANQAAEA